MSETTCTITGTIRGAQGQPRPWVMFAVRVTGGPGSEDIDRRQQHVRTDELGRFEVELVRGVEAVLTCQEIRYHRRITVPDVTTIDFRSLT